MVEIISLKSAEAIEAMRESGRINALAHQRLRSLIQAGISTAELNSIAESVIRENRGFASFRKVN